jgi:hypothetical protein
VNDFSWKSRLVIDGDMILGLPDPPQQQLEWYEVNVAVAFDPAT